MPDDLQEYLDLKREQEELSRRKARLEGAEAEHLRRLKDEFGVGDLDEAKEMLADLEVEERKARAKFDGELESYRKKWGDKS